MPMRVHGDHGGEILDLNDLRDAEIHFVYAHNLFDGLSDECSHAVYFNASAAWIINGGPAPFFLKGKLLFV